MICVTITEVRTTTEKTLVLTKPCRYLPKMKYNRCTAICESYNFLPYPNSKRCNAIKTITSNFGKVIEIMTHRTRRASARQLYLPYRKFVSNCTRSHRLCSRSTWLVPIHQYQYGKWYGACHFWVIRLSDCKVINIEKLLA